MTDFVHGKSSNDDSGKCDSTFSAQLAKKISKRMNYKTIGKLF